MCMETIRRMDGNLATVAFSIERHRYWARLLHKHEHNNVLLVCISVHQSSVNHSYIIYVNSNCQLTKSPYSMNASAKQTSLLGFFK
jgi:hypothetical protein